MSVRPHEAADSMISSSACPREIGCDNKSTDMGSLQEKDAAKEKDKPNTSSEFVHNKNYNNSPTMYQQSAKKVKSWKWKLLSLAHKQGKSTRL